MSWHIHATGAKEQVAAAVAAAEVNGQEQGELAKALICSALQHVPTNGVEVSASGHHDKYAANLEIKVRSMSLLLPEAEPEAAVAAHATTDA